MQDRTAVKTLSFSACDWARGRAWWFVLLVTGQQQSYWEISEPH